VLPLLLTRLAKLAGQPRELGQGGPEQRVCCFAGCTPAAAAGLQPASRGACQSRVAAAVPRLKLILSAETPGEGNLSPAEETRSRQTAGPWLVSQRHEEGGFLPASPVARRGAAVDHGIAGCPCARLRRRAELGSQPLQSHQGKRISVGVELMVQVCHKKMFLKLLLLRRTNPPLFFTAPYLVFTMKALVFRNRNSSHVNAYAKENKYNTHFCRRIYYLADQFKSKKKNLYIFEGSSCFRFLHPRR